VARTQTYQDYLDGKPGAEHRLSEESFAYALPIASGVLRRYPDAYFTADDVAARAVEKLFRAPEQRDNEAFLYTVTHRRALTELRKLIRQKGVVERLDGEDESPLSGHTREPGLLIGQWDDATDLLEEALDAVVVHLEGTIRVYRAEGTEPPDEGRRARITLWLFPMVDPDRTRMLSTELHRSIKEDTGKSDKTIWRDRELARDTAWPWVRARASMTWQYADEWDLLEKYCDRVELNLKGHETESEDE
jgi:DNA-directed RNA polymerase specialized sigma24 family protein